MSMDNQIQTKVSFFQKWASAHDFQTGGTSAFDSDTLNWILTRNGFDSIDELAQYIKQFPIILDAGCGNGRVLGMLAELSGRDQMLFGVDLAAAEIAQKNLNHESNVVVSQADLMDFSTLEGVCRPDFIYCQEVLHHTADPQTSFKNLVRMLNVGGEIAIYVYKEKAPIREFCDDYVRGHISDLNHDEASKRMLQFAEFGKSLSNLKIQIDVPEVSILGISAGSYDLQRFIYHHFMKCYWNDELTLEQNTMINFDWYHPTISSRHSLEEVRSWYVESGLKIIHEYVDEYGITMRGKK